MRALILALSLLNQATPALAEPNWLYLEGSGEGLQRIETSIDLNSSRLLPNGVTSYAWRTELYNPITLQKLYLEESAGIDCRTMEIVNIVTGKRTAFSKEIALDPNNKSPGAVAVRNFCPSLTQQPKKK